MPAQRWFLHVAALVPLSLAPAVHAQFGSASPPGPATPVTITGRIVTEDGRPVPGVQFMVPPHPGSMGLPEVTLFRGVPGKCFSYDPGTPVTDTQGRYRLAARFHPEVESGRNRCASYAARLRRENLNLIPLPSGAYQFQAATGPLPALRLNVPGGAVAPQKALPQGTFDPSTIRR